MDEPREPFQNPREPLYLITDRLVTRIKSLIRAVMKSDNTMSNSKLADLLQDLHNLESLEDALLDFEEQFEYEDELSDEEKEIEEYKQSVDLETLIKQAGLKKSGCSSSKRGN